MHQKARALHVLKKTQTKALPFVRTFAPFVAGVAQMSYPKFALYNVAGATLWVVSLAGIGYLFDLYYKRLDYGSATLVVICIVVVVIVIETLSSRIRKVIL